MAEPTETGHSALLAQLRAPFPAESVGRLPRVTQKDGAKSTCEVCGGFLPPHIHLDYVGHATVTDRLLSVDPEWHWEPFSPDDRPPLRLSLNEREWVLWVKLTVLGITRIGVGSVERDKSDVEKQLIGDAIRNASMRFGVGTYLWTRDELESLIGNQTVAATRRRRPPSSSTPTTAPSAPRKASKPDGPAMMTPADRNKLLAHLAHLSEPVVGAAVLAKVNETLRTELKAVSDLTAADGAALFAALGIDP